MKLPDTTLAYYTVVFRLRIRIQDAYRDYAMQRRLLRAMWAQRATTAQADLRHQVQAVVRARRRYKTMRDLLYFVMRDTRN